MKELLNSVKCVGIVGLSPDSTKDSNMVARFLLESNFKIVPIYPKGDEILGQKVFKTIKEALESNDIDTLVVFRKSEVINEVADEILSSNKLPKLVWLQLGIQNEQARKTLESKGIKVVENKCIKIELNKIKNDV